MTRKRNKKYRNIVFKMIGENESITKHPGYRTYQMMKQRCYNENAPDYKWYGERGISVCKEWEDSPVEFLLWYEKNHIEGYTLDRIDNNSNYSPTNCKYSNACDQIKNRRRFKIKTDTGVNFNKSINKWECKIRHNGKQVSLGSFDNEEDAIEIKLTAKRLIDENKIYKFEKLIKKRILTGYYFSIPKNRYIVELKVKGRRMYIGSFKSEEEAKSAARFNINKFGLSNG